MIYKFDSINFLISETVFEIFRKNCLKKTFVSCYGFLKCLDLGQITLFFVFGCFFPFIAGNLVSSGQHSHLNVSVILGVGVGTFSRCFEPLYLKNCWTYQNEHGSIRSSSAPFFKDDFLRFMSAEAD